MASSLKYSVYRNLIYYRYTMESLIPELALYGSKNECAKTNMLSLPLSQVSTGAVSLVLPRQVGPEQE